MSSCVQRHRICRVFSGGLAIQPTNLQWSEHVSSICARAKRLTYCISEMYGGGDVSTVRMFFTTYVRPILDYVDPVWWPSTKRDEDLLESVQRWNTRISYRWDPPSYENRLKIFDLPSFRSRRQRGDLIITYR